MGRRSRIRALEIWMNGERVGVWRRPPPGGNEFRYADSWLDFPETRPLSLSIPLTPAGYTHAGPFVESFFDNLLPDSTEIRQRLRQRFAAASLSAFDLLAEIGRDCVGAIQLLPEGEAPPSVHGIESRPLEEGEIESILRGVTTPGLGAGASEGSFRISIAGAQEKTALLWHERQWQEPRGATPTTHILKLPLGRIGGLDLDLRDSLENEWLCTRLAGALGFAVAPCALATFGRSKALVVERFDRRLAPDHSWIIRLPQEDFCQATGTPAHRKYEADGGPGIVTIMRVLLGAWDPFADRKTFMKAQLLFWLLAAPDGHAKNFSLFLEKGGRYRLTPLYDIISTYPWLGRGPGKIEPAKLRLAMAVHGKNRHDEWRRIRRRHWQVTAARGDFGGEMETTMAELAAGVPSAIARVAAELPSDFPDSVASPIFRGLQTAAARLGEEI